MTWKKCEREVRGEIMRTDVFVQIFSEVRDDGQMENDVDRAFDMFRDFESRFSRFREGNELAALNQSSEYQVSDDLLRMLLLCQEYFEETNGIFDPTVLPVLEREGYHSSFGTKNFGVPMKWGTDPSFSFSDIHIDHASQTVSKPADCRIDLGGIGKGYIVDCVSEMLSLNYQDFIVDAGGDMYVSGRNQTTRFPYFAIDIENPLEEGGSAGLLLLSDQAVATSGVNRRRWQSNGQEKSHLIHKERGANVVGDILTATVLASSSVRADIMAKTCCILGKEQGGIFAQKNHIPAIFLLKDGTIELNEYIKPYLWKDAISSAAFLS